MFSRYWRDYPWFLQLILFGLMVFTFVSFSVAVLTATLPKLSGFSFNQAVNAGKFSSKELIDVSIWAQAVTAIMVFLLPPVIFANLAHPSVSKYLNLKAPGKQLQWILVVVMWAGAVPLFEELGNLMKMIDLGKGANDMQSKVDEMTEAYLEMKNGGEFFRALLVMALIPAISEELFFRGILLRFFYQKGHRMVFAVLLTSLLFSLAHGTPYNYLPIFLAGILLCVTYYLTGSLLCGMLAHFFYNGSQIYIAYLANSNAALKEAGTAKHLPVALVGTGLVLFAGGLYALWKNRTPLPYNWADDFTPQELDERAKDETVL